MLLWAVVCVACKAAWESVCGIATGGCRHKPEADMEVHHIPTPLNESVVKKCPTFESFKPVFWAPGPYSQTLFGNLARVPKVPYKRDSVPMSDGVLVGVDWLAGQDSLPEDTPILLTLHGIAGSSEGWLSRELMSICREQGWRGVAFNRRGHGGVTTAVASPQKEGSSPHKAYPVHADIDDLHCVLLHITDKFKGAKIIAAGFSLGSNLLLRYLGIKAEKALLFAGVSASNGFDMVEGSMHIKDSHIDKILASRVKSIVKSNFDVIVSHGTFTKKELEDLNSHQSIRDLDQELACRMYGYKDVDEYYAENSCSPVLENIARPSLCLVSSDDPVCSRGHERHAVMASEVNPNLIVVVTATGGHLGWVEASGNWMIRAVKEYVAAILESTKAHNTV